MAQRRFNADNNGIPMLPGQGLDAKALGALADQAMEDWPHGKGVFYVIVDDRIGSREGLDPTLSEGKAYKSRAKAIKMAKARASGNIDQRVLKVSSEVFVLSTDAVERMDKREKASKRG